MQFDHDSSHFTYLGSVDELLMLIFFKRVQSSFVAPVWRGGPADGDGGALFCWTVEEIYLVVVIVKFVVRFSVLIIRQHRTRKMVNLFV